MKKFLGEFGSIIDPVVFVGRHADRTGMSEHSLMFTRMFGSYIPIEWHNIFDSATSKAVDKALRKNKTVVFSEMPWHNPKLMKIIKNSKTGNLVGVFPWDSDVIPENFISVLAKFNKIIVPTSFIQTTVLDALPELNVKVLPLALDLRRFNLTVYSRMNRLKEAIPRYGVIASRHPRKNLDLLLKACFELWNEGLKFELYLQGFLNQGASINSYTEKIRNSPFSEFFKVSKEAKSEQDFLETIDSFSVLVSVSSGEGFNIPARQALSCGIPIILTDIPGHAELKALPGVSMIKTSGKVPAVYPEFGNKIYGNQNLVTINSIKDAIRNSINAPCNISPELISASSSLWDYRKLEFEYRAEVFQSRTRTPTKKEKNLVVVGHDAGFFAIFNTFISITNSWTGEHGFTGIYPDWRVSSIQKFWKTKDFTSFCYGKPEDGNIYFKLFDASQQFDKNRLEIESIIDKSMKVHSFNASADPNLTFINADKLYRSAGFANWRKSMHSSMGNLHPNKNVQNRLQRAFHEVSSDAYIVGMHVRHPSHAIEQPDSQIALAADYIRIAEQLIKTESLRNPGRELKIFLATDQESVKNQFENSFGTDLLTISGVARLPHAESMKFERMDIESQLREGHQIQHLNAKNSEKWSLSLAEDVISDVWGLAKCQTLVHSVSNVATAVLFVNPQIESVQVYKGSQLEQINKLKELRRITQII
jgi:glycosyltransferase involved in cell wall biosynthesis